MSTFIYKTTRFNDPKHFWDNKIINEYGCWLWKGKLDKGYGRVSVGNHQFSCHRLAYIIKKGLIVEGLTIDHLCGNKACYNPAHLEQVSYKENNKRRFRSTSIWCSIGHPLFGPNAYLVINKKSLNKHRICRTCRDAKRKQYFIEKRK